MGKRKHGRRSHRAFNAATQRYWICSLPGHEQSQGRGSLTAPETPALSRQLGTQLERRKHLWMN